MSFFFQSDYIWIWKFKFEDEDKKKQEISFDLNLIDTPGIADTEDRSKQFLDEIAQTIKTTFTEKVYRLENELRSQSEKESIRSYSIND